MKILQVFNRYRERGGEEKSAQRIYEHARDVCDVSRLWWDTREWDKSDGPGKTGQLRRLFYNHESAGDLDRAIFRHNPDAVMCHNLYPVGSPAVYERAKEAGLPVIQYVHNFRPFSVGGSLWTGRRVAKESLRGNYWAEIASGCWQNSRLKSAIFALLLKRLHSSGWLDNVKCWVCISDFMRQQFENAGVEPGRLVTLRHSWDKMERLPEARDDGYYLFLARLVPEKGVRVLLDAWVALEQEMGKATPKLVVAGTGSEEMLVRRFAQERDRIEYVGFVDRDEKAELIGACRAMLAPSVWWEPLGLVTYEAYDYGKPMVAAASGGLTETVEDGVTGILCEPNDSSALRRGILRLENMTPEARREMGLAGRRWLDREASPEIWKAKFRKILTTVV